MADKNKSSITLEDGPYELLEEAESHLAELEKIKSKLPKFHGTSEEQAFFGLSKAIITSQRHVSLLMGSLEANGSKGSRYYK